MFADEAGHRGVWFHATVLDVEENRIHVCYTDRFADEGILFPSSVFILSFHPSFFLLIYYGPTNLIALPGLKQNWGKSKSGLYSEMKVTSPQEYVPLIQRLARNQKEQGSVVGKLLGHLPGMLEIMLMLGLEMGKLFLSGLCLYFSFL